MTRRMKQYIINIIGVVLILTFSTSTHGQSVQSDDSKVSLENTEQFSIKSESVPGENYVIQIGLPAGYSVSSSSYPVLYVLDGDKSFGMTKEITDWLMWDKEIKDIIVVGISYGRGTSIWWEKRARDFTQYKDTVYYYYPNAGGADNFLTFVKDELFPVINNKYRTIKDSAVIMGLSFGGLLSSYTLFAHPEMFKGYIIISPSLFWNDNSILITEAEYFSRHKDLKKTVYLAYGSLDNRDWTIDPTNELIKVIQKRNYEGFKFTNQVFNGETHISVFPIALTHGLKTVFRR
jgi:uncharacterized protein